MQAQATEFHQFPAKNIKRLRNVRTAEYVRLPICDLLFCIFSLSLYLVTLFCLLFVAFRLKNLGYFIAFCIIVSAALLASLTVCLISFLWYLKNAHGAFLRFDLGLHVTIHLLQFTTIWRHYLFFRRVPEPAIKLLFCELIILRLLHTAIFSLPCCLLLIFTLFRYYDNVFEIKESLLTAIGLTLSDFCLSLASYNRRTNRHEPDLLILSWPSILCQFGWRLGCVGARCVTLAAYASNFLYFTIIVVVLHWILMSLGLFMFTRPKAISSTTNDAGKRNLRWIIGCVWLGAVYIICYFNPSKENVKYRCGAFYGIMLAENSLLLIIWLCLTSTTSTAWIRPFVLGIGWGGFVFGLAMMIVYYKYLHVRKLTQSFRETRVLANNDTGSNAKNGGIIPNGAFVCRLPKGFPAAARKRSNVDQRSAKTDHNISQSHSDSPSDWSRNGRRSSSVPVSQRRRRKSATPTEDNAKKTPTEKRPSYGNGSRSLPRSTRNVHRRSETYTDREREDNAVPRSTFIETIF